MAIHQESVGSSARQWGQEAWVRSHCRTQSSWNACPHGNRSPPSPATHHRHLLLVNFRRHERFRTVEIVGEVSFGRTGLESGHADHAGHRLLSLAPLTAKHDQTRAFSSRAISPLNKCEFDCRCASLVRDLGRTRSIGSGRARKMAAASPPSAANRPASQTPAHTQQYTVTPVVFVVFGVHVVVCVVVCTRTAAIRACTPISWW